MASDNERGSLWNRWDPHIHAPGTILNDQFTGDDAWEKFLAALEHADPVIGALGITDYFSTRTYEAVLTHKSAGRLSGIELLFPNVEIRFGVETAKGSPINAHLLCSPTDVDHLDQLHRFLRGLEFKYQNETYCCTESDLLRLGRAFDPKVSDEKSALRIGTTQFKVQPVQLKERWNESAWAQRNVLIAVAGGGHDGTSGLKDDGSFAATRIEIERMAHIVFSAQPQQRTFWLGKGAASLEVLNAKWNGRKPCLHGSDAHCVSKTATPDLDRMCWLKGDLSFETLRQACIEPEERVFIGRTPPRGALGSQTIREVAVEAAPWMKNGRLQLNPGLVAIIGARGSGKTALADIIAAGGNSLLSHLNERSFVRRASPYLEETSVSLKWEAGAVTKANLATVKDDEIFEESRIQYLSQQFVDQLCSAEGLDDSLISEMERVVFDAHPAESRLGATTFRELLSTTIAPARNKRSHAEHALHRIAEDLAVQRELKASLPRLKKAESDLAISVAKDKAERTKLDSENKNEFGSELQSLTDAVDNARQRADAAGNRLHVLKQLRDSALRFRKERAQRLVDLKEEFEDAGLSDESWRAFETDYVGDISAILTSQLKEAEATVSSLKGPRPGEPTLGQEELRKTSLLPARSSHSDLSLSLLQLELTRVRRLAGVTQENARKLGLLSQKIATDEARLTNLRRQIARANDVDQRMKDLQSSRTLAYQEICESIEAEETALSNLYAPLRERMLGDDGALNKLEFEVSRTVDLESWAAAGERLMDLRRAGPFRGQGSLLEAAQKTLLEPWLSGSAAVIAVAMAAFRTEYDASILAHSPVNRVEDSEEAHRDWMSNVGKWLYSTDHIRVAYNIKFDGVGVRHLSPGTRGIVLLLLYLALDRNDDRPLLIDQPEENLDPKSIFDELVTRFRHARRRRQIIIVTHNANLVVNTDVDQVIVANVGPHVAGQLPEISYSSGSLENLKIRRQVCEILEGGELAFRERARRLRLQL